MSRKLFTLAAGASAVQCMRRRVRAEYPASGAPASGARWSARLYGLRSRLFKYEVARDVALKP
jgi:hypothetical protein